MERLSTRVWELEDELERTNERLEREVGEVLDKVQADEQMVEALKEVCPHDPIFFSIVFLTLRHYLETRPGEIRPLTNSRATRNRTECSSSTPLS